VPCAWLTECLSRGPFLVVGLQWPVRGRALEGGGS
jgi:hypothetical protein